MIKQQDLSKLNIDELKQKEKTLKTSLGIFIGLLIVMAVTVLFMYLKLKNTTITPFVLMASMIGLLLFNKKNLSDVQAEIKRRETK